MTIGWWITRLGMGWFSILFIWTSYSMLWQQQRFLFLNIRIQNVNIYWLDVWRMILIFGVKIVKCCAFHVYLSGFYAPPNRHVTLVWESHGAAAKVAEVRTLAEQRTFQILWRTIRLLSCFCWIVFAGYPNLSNGYIDTAAVVSERLVYLGSIEAGGTTSGWRWTCPTPPNLGFSVSPLQ